jgi:hypothetical protein
MARRRIRPKAPADGVDHGFHPGVAALRSAPTLPPLVVFRIIQAPRAARAPLAGGAVESFQPHERGKRWLSVR